MAESDLHTRLRSAIEERLALAQAATKGPWDANIYRTWGGGCQARIGPHGPGVVMATFRNAADPSFIAANSPDWVIRACRADLARLERHRPYDDGACHVCVEGWLSERDSPYGWWCPPEPSPCPEVRSLAEVWEVEL